MMLIREQHIFLEYILNIDMKKQNFIFVTGEAGTGKSYLLKLVVNILEEREARSSLVVAYTGFAALNVQGSTIHHALKIQIDKLQSEDDMKETALKSLALLALELRNLKWLIIDEISLVSEHFFHVIDKRLRSIKGIDKPFGNVSVLVFGDLLQLPPVSAKPIYFSCYWEQFNVYELKHLHRQENDRKYALLCNRARIGKLTEDDYNLLMTRHVSQLSAEEIESFKDALHIVLLKEDARLLNEAKQKSFKEFKLFDANDYRTDDGAIENVPLNIETNVPKTLKLSVGSKVMLKVNLNQNKGLVNGLIGTVVEFQDEIKCISVEFENTTASIGIYRFRSRIAPKKYFIREQYPLIHSWAINVHKVQGITLTKAIISLNWSRTSGNKKGTLFCTGLIYTLFSRVTNLSGLMINTLDKELILTSNFSKRAIEEYQKLNHIQFD